MKQLSHIALFAGVLLWFVGCLHAGTHQGGPLSLQARVADIVAGQFRPVADAHEMEQRIELLNPTLAIPDDAVLRVADMRMTGIPGTWMVRMQCFPIGECLSFHVLLHGEQSSSRAFAPIRQFGSTAVSSRSTIVANSGDRIQLVEQRDGLRITVGGVCLQSGSLGEKIYVRNLATHRVVLARIVARGKLEVQ